VRTRPPSNALTAGCIASLIAKSLVSRDYAREMSQLFRTPKSSFDIRVEAIKRAASRNLPWRIADFSMPVVVSVVATTMIVARLLLMQRKMRRISEGSSTLEVGIPYQQVIMFLLESALPSAVIGITGATAASLPLFEICDIQWLEDAIPFLEVLWCNALVSGVCHYHSPEPHIHHKLLGARSTVYRF
jgi:hypothetical protein